MDTEQIRRGLRNYKTRAATIEALAEEGAGMIEQVLPLLQDRHEGVRWSAIRILSEIGDERAVVPLITLLEQHKNSADVVGALRAITNQDIGDDIDTWRKWAMQEPELRNTAGLCLLTDEKLIKAATEGLPVTVTGKEQEYAVTVSLPEGRSQQVWIDFSRTDLHGQSMVQLSTPCGKAEPSQYERALTLNMSIPYGAVAIASLDDNHCFAVVDTYLRQTVHPEDIANSIMSLAGYGDSVEKSLSEEDSF